MNMKSFYIFILATFLSFSVQAQRGDREKLIKKIQDRPYPQWFKDAKLGIFVHWGLYSVPSYGGKESYSEWFLKGLMDGDSTRINFMRNTYGQNFTYNDFTSYFKAELFDPQEWASLFHEAGAKYVVLVSKHHDGYTLWPSKFNRNWNSVDTGPKRDIVGELSEAVRDEGLKMGLYYSLAEWNHPLHRWYTDPNDSIARYVDEYMIPQFKELVSTYKPSVIFADGEWFNTAEQWHAAELIDWYYTTVGSDAIVNNRWGHGIDVGFLTPEYSSGIAVTDRPWAEVRGIGRSFGLNRNEDLAAYGTSKELIQRFIMTVANGGGMILNVGPKADGQIPLIQQERLLQLGEWLNVNGSAIYGAKPYTITHEEEPISIQRIDSNIHFNWVRNSPARGIREDDFSAEWNGYIVAPESAEYVFEIKADDGAAIYIDNELVINQNYTAESNEAEVMGANTSASTTGKVRLEKGQAYPIRVQYNEKKQNAEITLFWTGKTFDKEVVPSSALFTNKALTEPGLKVTYKSMRTHICYTRNHGKLYAISFDWPEDELVLSIPKPAPSVKVSLLGVDRDLPWKYENGKLYINTSEVTYEELPSHDAWTFEISM